MIDFAILAECGTTNERIRQFFTAKEPSAERRLKMSSGELEALELDIKRRKDFESMLSGWLQEHIIHSLSNYHLYAAVDMAWDSTPINKQVLPLIQFAQGRIDLDRAAKALKHIPHGDYCLRKNAQGQVVGIDLPKFTTMNINLLRSVITRRVAAQAVKYNDLWPFFKYEPRSTTQVGRFRGDLTSQRMDIMADQFGYRHFQTQVTRDMFLYARSVAFPRASWEREVQWEKVSIDPDLATTLDADGKKQIRKQARVVKEGVCWVNPHPSRAFYDNNYPLSSLNTDTGCERVGFWDVCRWGDIANNANYFNRDNVSYSADTASWFVSYAPYFNQYFDKITPPDLPDDPINRNDRKMNVGIYNAEMADTAVVFTHVWIKVCPRHWGWGDYPFPVWVHLKVAGDATVVYADIMPSGPAAVFSFNEHDGRLLNISVAHELMQYQDQVSNLFSQLLETIKADLFSVAVLNRDVFPDTDEGKKVFEEFRSIMQGRNYYASMQILETSFEKLRGLGIDLSADNIFKVVRSTPNTQITAIFEAITHVVNMAEKMMVLSAHEQGQAASHEMSATESNLIAGSTDTIYSFISDAIDEGRSAMKRICFESTVACGQEMVTLPVSNRYPDSVIERAGFKVVERDEEDDPIGFKTVLGNKYGLVHDFIFTSRDGGSRPSNSQSATVLVQMLQAIGSLHPAMQNAIIGGWGKAKLYEFINTIFRLADAGVDMKLELNPGEDDNLMVEDSQQVMNIIQQLGQAVKQNTLDLAQVKQAGAALAAKVQTSANPPRESISINYKDAPEDLKRQMEMAAGFQPSRLPVVATAE